MEHIDIAALRPTLDALESKQIKAVVALIWPYSSSQRQLALLLAEPDLRLRRQKGQVRARFSSTSARALATTGVGIGDEVVLSLHGAQFVQDGAVSTPGKSIDWELAYTQTVAISVRRDGAEMANLELVDAAPTPAPRSPVKKPTAAPSPVPQWSSPAFLKRARLSDRPFFEQPAFDPLADEYNGGHDKKRRRKSYRDWTAWTYTTRTPSPEKEHVSMEDDLDEVMSSPSRPPQLPKTPISPSRSEPTSAAADALEDPDYVEETTIADSAEGDTTVDDGELRKVYAPLSASPERPQREAVPADDYYQGLPESQYDFGGDTELNTEDDDDDEDVTVPDVEGVEASATDVATELERAENEPAAAQPGLEIEVVDTASATEEDSVIEVGSEQSEQDLEVGEDTTVDETIPEVAEPEAAIVVEESLTVAMPPPSLPVLNTDFAAPTATDLLTPIGREPSSPNLKAVDSATLPLPSPFPGEQATSYFEHVSTGQQQALLDGPTVQAEPETDNDADYIMENSFFSSISSSRAGGLHQDHETAFTPVRFTFGMDGAGWSRPLDLSSPSPEDVPAAAGKDAATTLQDEKVTEAEGNIQPALPELPPAVDDVTHSPLAETSDEDVTSALKVPGDTPEPMVDVAQPPAKTISREAEVYAAEPVSKSPNLIILSSDRESEDSEDEVEDAVMDEPDEEQSEEEVPSEPDEGIEFKGEEEIEYQQALPTDNRTPSELENTASSIESEAGVEQPRPPKDDALVGTHTSAAVSRVVDLGSPSADEGSDIDDNDNASIESAPMQAGGDVDIPDSNNRAGAAEGPQNNDSDLKMGSTDESTASVVLDNFNLDNFTGKDVTQRSAIVSSSSPDRPIHEPASIAIPDTHEEPPSLAFVDWEPQLGMDEPLPFIEDDDASGGTQETTDAGTETVDVEMQATETPADAGHPDVKMESVEDSALDLISRSQDAPQESATDPATELLIAVPEDGHKLGGLHLKSVPANAPARNTRSKARSAASPSEEDGYVSRLSTSMRRTRSKASFDSTNRDTTSPTPPRGPPRSTVTPTLTREATQTSPYSLRSQSKQFSPDKGATTSQATVRRSPRKVVRRDTDFDIVPSQAENRDLFESVFEPSQELGFGYSQLSQGRYSDVGFVKDSEEDASHSEGSISTVKYSDDDGVQATNMSDPVEVAENVRPATPQLKPPPSFLQSQRQSRSRSRSMGQQGVMSPVLPPHSQRRSPRLTRSAFSPTPRPRNARTTRGAAQASSPVRGVADEDQNAEETPKAIAQSIIYPVLPAESEGGIRSSPPAPASAQHSNLRESNPLTADGTQQTAMEPPLSFQARQPEHSLLTTSELTQQTSASATLRSFDIPLPGIETQPAPNSPMLRTSPRRKPTVASVKSSSPIQQSSSIHQSSDAISADDEDATLVTKPNPPSIGLSTPLAYYTPLRDLIYFLNRSSQFHSSSNPDILALCTSSSTPPDKAKRGPRHWNTTLHITDLSVWPEVRTVNVFRAYQSALPVAEAGDVILLRAFAVESRKREPVLRTAEESSWCVWRFGRPVWGKKGGKWGELRAREEVKGPVVERGQGEWMEVEKLRGWYTAVVREELGKQAEESEGTRRGLRSSSKGVDVQVDEIVDDE